MHPHVAQALRQWRADAVARYGRDAVRRFVEQHPGELAGIVADFNRAAGSRKSRDRLRANAAALKILENTTGEYSAEDLETLATYTGWGGLPAECTPRGSAGVDEYFTPPDVATAIASAMRPLVTALACRGEVIHALEPGAGIGSLMQAVTETCPHVPIRWTAIEPSPTACQILRILRSGDEIANTTFEQWDATHGGDVQGRIQLVLANPPFCVRGGTTAVPAEYREAPLYAYFLRRCLDLLGPGGVAVFVVPKSCTQSEIRRALRTRVLTRAKLIDVYRLPRRVFPGVDMHVDVLALRARAGRSYAFDAREQAYIDGTYLDSHPAHVLKNPVTIPELRDDCPNAIAGTTDGVPRPSQPTEEAAAAAMGRRIRKLRACTSDHAGWVELRRDLDDLLDGLTHKNPWQWTALSGDGADDFRSAFTRRGELAVWVGRQEKRQYNGRPELGRMAAWLHEQSPSLLVDDLLAMYRQAGGKRSIESLRGWVRDGEYLVPEAEFFTGDLWGRLGRATDPQIVERLQQAIDPIPVEDIEDLSPRLGWVPLALVSEWVSLRTGESLKLDRVHGTVTVAGVEPADLAAASVAHVTELVQWLNYASPDDPKQHAEDFCAWVADDVERRLKVADAYNRATRGYVSSDLPCRAAIPRWGDTIKLYAHQWRAVSHMLAVRNGIVAYDPGVGKTYAGIATLAAARHRGEARRPVIVVPLSLAWQWYASIMRALPDYRVCVIGSRQSGRESSSERRDKWRAFERGLYDVAIVTMPTLERLSLRPETVKLYSRWLGSRAQALEFRGALPFDRVDFLLVDEIASYKNLFYPQNIRPRYMGVADSPSSRAQRMHALAYAVRQNHGRVVGLTATPAKNSPLELYNLLDIVAPQLWEGAGIYSPAAFLARYVSTEVEPVPTANGKLARRLAATGFVHLRELWRLVSRVMTFGSAADCGLELPTPRTHVIAVDLDSRQQAKTHHYLEHLRVNPRDFLGTQVRLARVAVHADLDDRHTWESAGDVDDPVSPKFEAVAERVATGTCNHLVFVESPAAQRWQAAVLVRHGVPAERIGVLNGRVTAAQRREIAEQFNRGALNVVLANSVAYEGLDLQDRTCGIHHVDIPWGPSDLCQRNGRGVRQNNAFESVEIFHYVANGSIDRYRLAAIDGKASWLATMRRGEDRVSNPARAMFVDHTDLQLHLTDGHGREELLEARAKHRRAEQAAAARRAVVRLAYRTAARFRDARETSGWMATLRHSQGVAMLRDLAQADASVWPWAAWMGVVRDVMPLVPRNGSAPVFEGLRVCRGGDCVEFGRVAYPGVIGVRTAGSGVWVAMGEDDVSALGIRPSDMPGGRTAAPWPTDDDTETVQAIVATANELKQRPWPQWGWHFAPDQWVARVWPQVAKVVAYQLQKNSAHPLPILRDTLELAVGADVMGHVLPPTHDGWRTFLQWAPQTDIDRHELEEAARYWWGRSLPEEVVHHG